MRFSAAMPRRDDDHGDLARALDDLEDPADFVAVQIGEHQVEEDDVRDLVCDLLEGLARR